MCITYFQGDSPEPSLEELSGLLFRESQAEKITPKQLFHNFIIINRE